MAKDKKVHRFEIKKGEVFFYNKFGTLLIILSLKQLGEILRAVANSYFEILSRK